MILWSEGLKANTKFLMGMFFLGNFIRWVNSRWENIEQMFVLTENTHLWNGLNPQVPQPLPHMELGRTCELARRLIVPASYNFCCFWVCLISTRVWPIIFSKPDGVDSNYRVFQVWLIWKTVINISRVNPVPHSFSFGNEGKNEIEIGRKGPGWQVDTEAKAFWYSRRY